MKIILHILVAMLSVAIIGELIPGVSVAGWYEAFIVVMLLFVINVTLKPILYILTLPINLITLGLFSFVINGALLYFVSTIVQGFHIDSIWIAILAALIVSAIRTVGDAIIDILP